MTTKRIPTLEPGTPCLGCDYPLRPNGTTAEEYPGMLMHRSKGRCTSCMRHGDGARIRWEEEARRKAAQEAMKAIDEGPTAQDYIPATVYGHDDPDPEVRNLAKQAQDFLDARRRRGVPPQGYQDDVVVPA